MTTRITTLLCSLLMSGMIGAAVLGQDAPAETPADTPDSTDQPAAVEADPVPVTPDPIVAPDEAEAADAMDDMLGSRETAPVIEPIQRPRQGPEAKLSAPASAAVDIDPALLGVAPGDEPPPLRREGEFIVNRSGRLVRSAESGHLLFVFEADGSDNPELPLVMQACQLLETMEDTIDRRGESTVFILSGQVHTYRGANYLLPTMMKITVDNGNLTN